VEGKIKPEQPPPCVVYVELYPRIEKGPVQHRTSSRWWGSAMRPSIAVIVVSVVTTSCIGASDDSETEPSPEDTYRDPAGWSAQIPPDWIVLPFETSNGDAAAAGVRYRT
jgi:hypothetical protein